MLMPARDFPQTGVNPILAQPSGIATTADGR
jgi:hypothetical protein